MRPQSSIVMLFLSAVLSAAAAHPRATPRRAPTGPCDSALASQYEPSVESALPGFLGRFTRLDSTATHRVAITLAPAICRRAARALAERDRESGRAAAAPDSVAVVTVDDSLFYVVLRRDRRAGEWYPAGWFGHDWQWITGLLL